MPLVVLLLLVLLTPLLAIALMPVALVFRYRAGTTRRLARRWVALVNASLTAVSTALMMGGAAVTGVWVAGTFSAAASGVAVGVLVGVLGLVVSRWDRHGPLLYYTPNRWLVLALMLLVSGRLAYGLWRAWHAWWAAGGDTAWLAAAGIPGSLAAGGVVLGYYFAFWVGVSRRLERHRRSQEILTIDVSPVHVVRD